MTRRSWIGIAMVSSLLSACASGGPMDSLDPQGPIATDIDGLFRLTLNIATVIFVLVTGALLYASIRFRDRGDRTPEPKQVEGNARFEVIWTVIPVLILASIAVPTVDRIFKYTSCADDALHIEVTGHQWWFEYNYPDDGFSTANVLVMPTDTEICLDMSSNDVIHNYWVPKLNGKRYLVPGQATVLLLRADEPGEYWGQCAEFCGLSHAKMRARVIAMTPDDYADWLTSQQRPASMPAEGTIEQEGMNLFLGGQCVSCHNISGATASNPALATGSIYGPDLTHFSSRDVFAGATLNHDDPGAIESWIDNPPLIKPGSFMPNIDLTQQEIEALAAYLRSLD